MPEVNTEAYLRKVYSSVYQSTLNGFIADRLNYINSIGPIEYTVYEKQNDGSLKSIDSTTQNKITIITKESGNHTYVVKTSYRNFKSNASDGKEVTINVNIENSIAPKPNDNDDDDDTDSTNSNSNNDNSNTNTLKPNRH